MRLLETLRHLQLPANVADKMTPLQLDLRLRRAWPRSKTHLHLEYVDALDRIVPGQWFQDPARVDEVVPGHDHDAASATPVVHPIDSGVVILQPNGCDRKLRGLQSFLREPHTQLVGHRPERRAVLHRRTHPGQFVKVMRPRKLARLIDHHAFLESRWPRPVELPEILDVDRRQNAITFAALCGKSLFDTLPSQSTKTLRQLGAAVGWLHGLRPPNDLPAHGPTHEIELLEHCLDLLGAFDQPMFESVQCSCQLVLDQLVHSDSEHRLLHRDLHDKQVLIDHDRIALIDWDAMAVGEPALDVANLIGHFELRVLQGRVNREVAEAAADAFLEGYDPSPSTRERLQAYRDATRMRLVCVYAFRPDTQPLCHALGQSIGSTAFGGIQEPGHVGPSTFVSCEPSHIGRN